MANNRRQRRTSSTTPRSSQRAAASTAAPATASPRDADAVDWQEEYAYVFRDLRHLTVISVSIFALLLIIGYFL